MVGSAGKKVILITSLYNPNIYLEPQTAIYKWLFQLDDSQSLHRKWLFHQTSIFKWLFGVPGIYIPRTKKWGGPLVLV